ncbi:MAG: HEAT repeat domain-containing protein [Oscillospiraceae bacterium]|jgi:HEAT repeat protein|nr:HEAT repeat domain-containing protein [Oscillospiraceae bacterium]
MEHKTFDEKWEILQEIDEHEVFSTEDTSILKELYTDEDSLIRGLVAGILCFVEPEISTPLLMTLANDSDALVRTEACDSLCNCKGEAVFNLLKDRLIHDKSSLFRSYAALSLADITKDEDAYKAEAMQLLTSRLEKERVINTKISFFRSLYLLSKEERYLDALLPILQNRRYQNRCAVAHSLSSVCFPSNMERIEIALKNQYAVESTVAAKSSIESTLHD